MNKLSVVILTKNEEKNILDCLESIGEVDEILIIDDFSTDRTREVIKSLNKKNVKIIEHAVDGDFASQRNFALAKAKNDWTLFIDADERLTENLKSEIEGQIINTSVDGFYIARKDVMWGKELKHGDAGTSKLLRLAKRNGGKWAGRIHEVWNVEGQVTVLKNELLHYPHQTVKEFLAEINFYTTIRADELYEQKVKVSLIDVVLYTKAKFLANYFLKLGVLDGMQGLVAAFMMSMHSFLVRSKLWLRYQK